MESILQVEGDALLPHCVSCALAGFFVAHRDASIALLSFVKEWVSRAQAEVGQIETADESRFRASAAQLVEAHASRILQLVLQGAAGALPSSRGQRLCDIVEVRSGHAFAAAHMHPIATE